MTQTLMQASNQWVSRPHDERFPIENVLDLVVAATTHARSIPNTNDRIEVERVAGTLLQAAAA